MGIGMHKFSERNQDIFWKACHFITIAYHIQAEECCQLLRNYKFLDSLVVTFTVSKTAMQTGAEDGYQKPYTNYQLVSYNLNLPGKKCH